MSKVDGFSGAGGKFAVDFVFIGFFVQADLSTHNIMQAVCHSRLPESSGSR